LRFIGWHIYSLKKIFMENIYGKSLWEIFEENL